MKIRPGLASALLVVVLAAAGQALAAEPAAGTKTAKASPEKPGKSAAVREETAKLLPKLKEGMPADAVRQLLGAPDEVSPMEAPTGKAEVWAYTREISRRREQVVTYPNQQVIVEPQANGPPITRTVLGSPQTIYLEFVLTEKVEVLLFDGRYVVHKVSREERKL